MVTNWQEQNKDLVDTGEVYNDASINYNDANVRYGGGATPVWTEQTKN